MSIQAGDVVRCRGDRVRVNKLSKKTFRGDILDKPYLGEYFSKNRQFDMTEITEVLERASESGEAS